MKKTLVALFLFFTFRLGAADASAASWWIGPKSQYVTVNAVQAYDKPVTQGNWNQPLKAGFYANIWFTQSIDGENNEIDFTGGFANDHLDTSFSFFDLDPVGKSGDMFYPSVKVMLPMSFGERQKFTPYAITNYVLARQHPDKNNGFLLQLGADHSFAISDKITLLNGGWLMWDQGVFAGDQGYSFRYESGLSFDRGPYSLVPSLQASKPIGMSDKKGLIILSLRLTN